MAGVRAGANDREVRQRGLGLGGLRAELRNEFGAALLALREEVKAAILQDRARIKVLEERVAKLEKGQEARP